MCVNLFLPIPTWNKLFYMRVIVTHYLNDDSQVVDYLNNNNHCTYYLNSASRIMFYLNDDNFGLLYYLNSDNWMVCYLNNGNCTYHLNYDDSTYVLSQLR